MTVGNGGSLRPKEKRQYRMLVNGKWIEASSGKTFDSVDPYTGQPWAAIPEATSSDVDGAVKAAQAALDGPWGRMSGTERARLIRRLAEEIDSHAEALAITETIDNGKVIREMRGQLQNLPEWYYSSPGRPTKSRARRFLGPRLISSFTPFESQLVWSLR